MRVAKVFIILLCCLTWSCVQAQSRPSGPRLKVGLVLGGGGAKGAAEVGVLKAIEKAGIPIDYIAGTSIGSIVGGLYSCGYRAAQLDSIFRSQEWIDLLSDRDEKLAGRLMRKKKGVTYVLGFPLIRQREKFTPKSFGAIKGDNIVRLLERMTQHKRSLSFDKLPIPFRCVATDLHNQQEIVLDSGKLPQAMRASMAIPGVFKPVVVKSRSLFDGGLCNNLPVDVVRAMGADIVIAIDLTQDKHEGKKRKKAPAFLKLMDSELARLAVWAIERPDLTKYRRNRENVDLYINPNLKNFGAGSFSAESIARMINIGESAGEDSYPELVRLRKRIFNEP